MTSEADSGHNRLINEKSPYLQQHADNPVDWFPWGDEAFDKARGKNRPVLVSIGYATCHWCHVMADESFADPEVAELMNRYLVNIKIDREERPDLDQIYITAVSALTGSAGWPLNVFLTPEGKPFFGGTYFPTRGRSGMPSWTEVVNAIGQAWQDSQQREKLTASADNITNALLQHLQKAGPQAPDLPEQTILSKALDALAAGYDPKAGGFSGAPKFPMPTILDFLLFYHRYTQFRSDEAEKGNKALEMTVHTLKQMADGGIYDHIGGGFHRYSTDAHWHVPHFEKMLYDNAQLISVYLDAYEITGEPLLAEVARDCLDYVLREMTHPDGGFYSAEDADSYPADLTRDGGAPASDHKVEGAFYVWRKAELEAILDSETSRIAAFRWGAEGNGNAKADPFGEFKGKNIFFRARSIQQTAAHFQKTEEAVQSALAAAREALFEARKKRPRPFLDDKVLTEWNALMISALARAYRVLGDELYLTKAREAAAFLHDHLSDGSDRRFLYRRWREGERRIEAMAGDYALLTQSLLDLYEAGFDPFHLEWAIELGGEMLERFHDRKNGGFFMTSQAQDRHLLLRAKDFNDGVMPSATAVAALNCLRLYRLTGESRFEEAAHGSFRAAADQMARHPGSAPQLLKALGSDLLGSAEVIILGNDNRAKEVQPMSKSYRMKARCPQCGCSAVMHLSKEEIEERFGHVPNAELECSECMEKYEVAMKDACPEWDQECKMMK